VSSSGLSSMDYFGIHHFTPGCVVMSGLCGFISGNS
jgi:hypothetical protein